MKKLIPSLMLSAAIVSGAFNSFAVDFRDYQVSEINNVMADPVVQKVAAIKWYIGGDGFFVCDVKNDVITFSEGYPGDTGGSIQIKHTTGNNFQVISDGDSRYGEKARLATFNGVNYLLFFNASGVLVKTARDRNFSITHRYSGYYKGSDGKQYFIDPNGNSCSGFAASSYSAKSYMDDEEWNYTVELTIGNQTFFPISGKLLDSNKRQIAKLSKTYPTDRERYPFTATQIVDPDDLLDVPAQELKIMRNEIYARHGYTFSTAAMKNHFSAQSWYKATKTNVDADLSEIEKYNIQFIKSRE